MLHELFLNANGAKFSWCSDTGIQAGELLRSHATEPHSSTSKSSCSSCTWTCCGYGNSRIGGALPRGTRARCQRINSCSANLPGEEPVCVPFTRVAIPTSTLSAVGPATPCLPAPDLKKPGEPVALFSPQGYTSRVGLLHVARNQDCGGRKRHVVGPQHQDFVDFLKFLENSKTFMDYREYSK